MSHTGEHSRHAGERYRRIGERSRDAGEQSRHAGLSGILIRGRAGTVQDNDPGQAGMTVRCRS